MVEHHVANVIVAGSIPVTRSIFLSEDMIKLIATDLDGTLLDDNKQLPPGFFDAILKLKAHGVRFVIASGRQYYNIVKIFEELQDDLYFLGDNGAVAFEGRNCMGYTELPPEVLLAPLERVRSIPTAHPIFCGVDCAYSDDTDPYFCTNARKYNSRFKIVPHLPDVLKTDHICKLAVFDSENAEKNTLPNMKQFAGDFTLALAGEEWLDCMPPGMNKGIGLKLIQQKLGISPEETMAFGDYHNDLEMLQSCHYSYAMKNAHPDILKTARYTTEYSNNEYGVMKTLQEYFDFL